MKPHRLSFLLILTFGLLTSGCTQDSSSEAGPEGQSQEASAEPEPKAKPSEVLVGTWSSSAEGIEAMKGDMELKALIEELESTDKGAAFMVMMELMGFSAVQWTFAADGTVKTQVADFILAAEEAAGQAVRDASGSLVNKTYRDMADSGTWSTDVETDSEITITVKDLGKDSQQFSFRVVDGGTIHALIANKRYPFPLSRLK